MEEELIKRILPHSDDAERSVIGCMMMNREAIMIASEILTGDEFYRQQMGIVFDSMVELYNEGKPVWSPCRTACVKRMFRRRSAAWNLQRIF